MNEELGFLIYNIDELREAPWDPQVDRPGLNAVGEVMLAASRKHAFAYIQEVTTNALHLISLCFPAADYACYATYRGLGGVGYDPGGISSVLLIPRDVASVTRCASQVLHYDGSEWFPAVIQQAWVRSALGELRVINVHGTTTAKKDEKGNGTAEREQYRTAMLADLTQTVLADTVPTILAGDFNIDQNAPCIESFVQQTDAIDVLRFLGYTTTRTEATQERAKANGWDFQPWSDFLFAKFPRDQESGWGIKSLIHFAHTGSDHYPITATLRRYSRQTII